MNITNIHFEDITPDKLIFIGFIVLFVGIGIPFFISWMFRRIKRERKAFITALRMHDDAAVIDLYKTALPTSTALAKMASSQGILPIIYHTLLLGDLQAARLLLDEQAGVLLKSIRSGNTDIYGLRFYVDQYLVQPVHTESFEEMRRSAQANQFALLDAYLTLNGAPSTLPAPSTEYNEVLENIQKSVFSEQQLKSLVPGLQDYQASIQAAVASYGEGVIWAQYIMWGLYACAVAASAVVVYIFVFMPEA